MATNDTTDSTRQLATDRRDRYQEEGENLVGELVYTPEVGLGEVTNVFRPFEEEAEAGILPIEVEFEDHGTEVFGADDVRRLKSPEAKRSLRGTDLDALALELLCEMDNIQAISAERRAYNSRTLPGEPILDVRFRHEDWGGHVISKFMAEHGLVSVGFRSQQPNPEEPNVRLWLARADVAAEWLADR